jgi:hypothetical protein
MKAVLNTRIFSPVDQYGKYGMLGWVMRTRTEVEVGMCRFMVYLMAQRAIRSPVNTYVQKGKVAVFISMVN